MFTRKSLKRKDMFMAPQSNGVTNVDDPGKSRASVTSQGAYTLHGRGRHSVRLQNGCKHRQVESKTNPIPINQSARSRRHRLSVKSCRDRVKNTSIKNSLKWAYDRGAVRPRAGSNLGHFPAQFELNSTTLYIMRRPPIAPAAGPLASSRSHARLSARSLKTRASRTGAPGRRGARVTPRSQLVEVFAKIDFLSAWA
ncbi:hypothetical protein EVAR_88668_1 [Eumeta japonica]|uniref:Uncharacterized protein n=1 Tax=Eumeta variegata TaxID=151549 RepID=A0A4C1Y908_EUMVA|nr:hypothetical protein EVAR_88668_1 [Eumeta japonica]